MVFNYQSLGRESKASLRNDFLKRQEFAISVSTLMLGQATERPRWFRFDVDAAIPKRT